MPDEFAEDQSEWLTGTIPLNIAGVEVVLQVDAPAGPTRPRRLLPVFQQITNAIVNVAVKKAEGKGKIISCKAGCGACCRQLVPIAEIEAFHLRDLVEEMDEPRKAEIKTRFTAALEILKSAGFLEMLERPRELSLEERKTLGNEYFKLQIACPFLENESCSIHPNRPLSCREYLVTSPSENCARPQNNIEGVDLPAKVSISVYALDSDPSAKLHKWVPLILALEWANAHEDDSTPRNGPDLVMDVINGLSK